MASQEQELGEKTPAEEQVAGCAEDPTAASATAHAGAAGSEDVNLSKLLSRFRNEAMYELRKLKLQQRPVSEFQNKDNLEQLLTQRAPQPPAGSAPPVPDGADNEQATVAARARDFASRFSRAAAQQSQMPESVQLEVRFLVQQRPVRSVLQSPAVQERMERALRDGLERRHRRQEGRRQRPQHNGGGDDARGNLLSAIRGNRTRRQARSHGLAAASPSLQRRARRASQRPPGEGGQYPVPRRDQGRILEQVRQSPALQSLDPDARNRIVTEVSHLVQQQLVTSALSGEFRGVLELHIQERAERVSQGMTAEEVIQSRQQRSRPGSAFSYRSDDGDSLPSGSLSQLQQEVQGLKSQMLELKQMMKVNFDLQLDIQRSIRQEVAAAFAGLCSPATLSVPGTASGASITDQVPPFVRPHGGDGGSIPHVVDSGNCVICSEAGIDSVVYRCGHMCVCMSCGLELKAQGLKCPICRAPITDIVRAYASML